MEQEIIDKLELKESELTLGESYLNKIKIYEHKDGWYIANCDNYGRKLVDNQFIVFTKISKTHFVFKDWLLMEDSSAITWRIDYVLSQNLKQG